MAVMDHWKFSIAPMMGRSDRHCRYFWRLLSSEARLYTEMITTGALIHGNSARLLKRNASDQPISLQLGGVMLKTTTVRGAGSAKLTFVKQS